MARHDGNPATQPLLSTAELSILCEQLALILGSGLPLHDGVEALCENYRDTRYAEAFEALNQAVLETGSLREGLQAAGVFPVYLVEMAQIGEKTGELDHVMSDLAAYYQREDKVHKAIRNAVVYPLVLVCMMAVLIVVLVTQVLPIFEDVFRGMGLSLEGAGGAWMSVGIGVGRVALIAAGAFVLLALVFALILRGDGHPTAKSFLFRVVMPLQRLNQKLCAGRFASTLAMMLSSGYPLDESLELIENILTDPDVAGKVRACRERMRGGEPFPGAIESIGLFERLHCRMVRVGFQAGQTDTVMRRLAGLYDEEMDESISRVVGVIEPTLVALMSVIIGAILLSVMLPLMSVLSGMM